MIDSRSYTRDSISLRGAGVVTLTQPKKGHRFTLDSLLLADFCVIKSRDRVLEPGSGTGAVSVLLAKKHPRALIYAVEIQPDLIELCKRNCSENGVGKNCVPVQRDIRRLAQSINPGGFDVVVANPPYIKEGTGRKSPDQGRHAARHDLLGGIEFWLDLGKFLKQRGKYGVVFPASRLSELLALMRDRRLEPKRLRLVHPYGDQPAILALVQAVKGGGSGVDVLPPLILHQPDGSYTKEMRAIYDLP